MRQKKKILLAGILCCMCLGSVCVSIGVRGRFPGDPGRQMQIEEQKLPERRKQTGVQRGNRQEEAAAEQKERSTETETEKNVPNVPAPKTGDSWWK